MMTPKMQDALSRHVTAEFFSSNLYLAMAAWAEANTYKGFARWLRVQAEEERAHALKLFDFVLARGGTPKVGAVEAPRAAWKTILAVFEEVQAHERKVTGAIDALYALAVKEADPATQIFLQWFVSEQVEEEANAAEIVEKLTMIGDKPATVLYLDKEYGKRGK